MAEKQIYIVDEIGGDTFVVKADSGSQAKAAVKKELTVRKATAMDAVAAMERGVKTIDAEAVLAEKAAKAAEAQSDTEEPSLSLDSADKE